MSGAAAGAMLWMLGNIPITLYEAEAVQVAGAMPWMPGNIPITLYEAEAVQVAGAFTGSCRRAAEEPGKRL